MTSTNYAPTWFPSPIKLSARRAGRMKIRHRVIQVGQAVSIVGMRQALVRGITPVSGRVEKPLRVHELVEEGHGIWMTDLPEELNQIAEMLHNVNPRGRVLVGGLGLGILAAAVAARPGVESVIVIERSAEVIELCQQPGYAVVQKDIKTYLELSAQPVDYYLLDTWTGTNEGAWWEDVLPLRRIIRRRWGRKPVIHCWAEDIMLGQILRTLTTSVPHWYYKELPLPMSLAAARWFVANVGLPSWERKYGLAVDNVLRNADSGQ